MPNAFLRKLEAHGSMPIELQREIELLTSHVDCLNPREEVSREGEEPHIVNVLLSGWAGLYKSPAPGRRQITAVFLPGDICNLDALLLGALNHRVATFTPVTVARIRTDVFHALMASDLGLTRALQWQIGVALATQREWTLSLGQRSATERVAHLLCEIWTRLELDGLIHGSACDFPLTQPKIADVTGLSGIHVNRVLQGLRADGLADVRRKQLVILNRQMLAKVAFFNPTYLHGHPKRGQVHQG